MKANGSVESVKRLSRHDDPNQRGGSFPRVAYDYQSTKESGTSFGRGLPMEQSGINRLARQVLRSDASRTFWLESTVLGLITAVSAWPIVLMIREVMRLLK